MARIYCWCHDHVYLKCADCFNFTAVIMVISLYICNAIFLKSAQWAVVETQKKIPSCDRWLENPLYKPSLSSQNGPHLNVF